MDVLLFLETVELFLRWLYPFTFPAAAWRVPVPPRGSWDFSFELLLCGWSTHMCGERLFACSDVARRGVGRQALHSGVLPHALYVLNWEYFYAHVNLLSMQIWNALISLSLLLVLSLLFLFFFSFYLQTSWGKPRVSGLWGIERSLEFRVRPTWILNLGFTAYLCG